TASTSAATICGTSAPPCATTSSKRSIDDRGRLDVGNVARRHRRRARAPRPDVAPHRSSVPELAALHVALGEAFGEAARTVAGGRPIDYVASHGQTIFHDGPGHVTWQLGDAFALRERAGATVVY